MLRLQPSRSSRARSRPSISFRNPYPLRQTVSECKMSLAMFLAILERRVLMRDAYVKPVERPRFLMLRQPCSFVLA